MRLIDVDKLIDELCSDIEDESFGEVVKAEILKWLDAQPIVAQWHKLIFRPLTDEEKEFHPEWTEFVENLPDLNKDVLVTDGVDVWIDSFDINDYVYLSGTHDDIYEVIAWMELPSYKGEQ